MVDEKEYTKKITISLESRYKPPEKVVDALPTTSTITISGYNGYNNAVKLIDDVCYTLYNSELASSVQNLKIEDIEDKMVEKDYTKFTANYGASYTPPNAYFSSILMKEKNQQIKIGSLVQKGTEWGIVSYK